MYEKMRGKHFVAMVNDDKGGLDEAMGYGGTAGRMFFASRAIRLTYLTTGAIPSKSRRRIGMR